MHGFYAKLHPIRTVSSRFRKETWLFQFFSGMCRTTQQKHNKMAIIQWFQKLRHKSRASQALRSPVNQGKARFNRFKLGRRIPRHKISLQSAGIKPGDQLADSLSPNERRGLQRRDSAVLDDGYVRITLGAQKPSPWSRPKNTATALVATGMPLIAPLGGPGGSFTPSNFRVKPWPKDRWRRPVGNATLSMTMLCRVPKIKVSRCLKAIGQLNLIQSVDWSGSQRSKFSGHWATAL